MYPLPNAKTKPKKPPLFTRTQPDQIKSLVSIRFLKDITATLYNFVWCLSVTRQSVEQAK